MNTQDVEGQTLREVVRILLKSGGARLAMRMIEIRAAPELVA